tara:strand:+ start:79 stop:321 length:243 start_codon:yes stop_codon:yes gene_type:complete
MSNKRIDIEGIEARMRLWAIGDVSDEELALELDYIVPELKRCYEKLDNLKRLVTWNHTDSNNIASDDDLLLVLTELLTSE